MPVWYLGLFLQIDTNSFCLFLFLCKVNGNIGYGLVFCLYFFFFFFILIFFLPVVKYVVLKSC